MRITLLSCLAVLALGCSDDGSQADDLGLTDAIGDVVAGNQQPFRMSSVCPPDTIAKDTPYPLKVQYTVPCLGERKSFSCTVTVDGTTIRAQLYLEEAEGGCDATDFSTHDATCELPALAAGDYSFYDEDCTTGDPVVLHVGEQTSGSAQCEDAPCM